jgi:hypothetical protein
MGKNELGKTIAPVSGEYRLWVVVHRFPLQCPSAFVAVHR